MIKSIAQEKVSLVAIAAVFVAIATLGLWSYAQAAQGQGNGNITTIINSYHVDHIGV